MNKLKLSDCAKTYATEVNLERGVMKIISKYLPDSTESNSYKVCVFRTESGRFQPVVMLNREYMQSAVPLAHAGIQTVCC